MELPPITRAPTPNFTRGRQGHRILGLVLHVMEGTMAGTRSWFASPQSRVSAHYGIGRDGSLVQWVDDGDTAWHAGVVQSPTWPLLVPGVNPNLVTIGIEHEGRAGDGWTPPMLDTSARLVAHLCRTHGLALGEAVLPYHREIRADKTCPGALSRAPLLSLARQYAGEQDTDRPPGWVWSAWAGRWLLPVTINSDTDWTWVDREQLQALRQTRATTPLSRMPTTPT